MSHLQKLSLSYYSNTRAGEVISRVINDVEQTKNFVMIGLMNVWLDLATILIAIAIMLTMDVPLTLVTLLAFPFYAYSVKHFFGKLRESDRETISGTWQMCKVICMNAFQVSVSLKVLHLKKKNKRILMRQMVSFLIKQLIIQNGMRKHLLSLIRLRMLHLFLCLLMQVIKSSMDRCLSERWLHLLLILIRLYSPLRRLVNSSTSLTQSFASMDRVFELMEEQYDVTDKTDAIELPPIDGKIEFDNVSFIL